MTNQTKLQLLIALLLVWGGTVLFQYLDDTETPVPYSTNAGSGTGLLNTPPNSLVLAKSFASPRQSITLSTPRNIFSPFNLRSPQPVAQKQKTVPSKQKTEQAKPVQPESLVPPGPSPIELATQRAKQELSQFRFLGYLKKGGERQAFLTKGQAIYIVKQGATVEGRILVNRIHPTLIVLSTLILESGDQVEAEIPLTKDSQSSS